MKNTPKQQKRNSENKDKSANNKTKADSNAKAEDFHKAESGSGRFPAWFYFVPVLIPIVFFILLETGLRLFNYGKDIETFVELSKNYPGMLFMNPEVPFRYFSSLKTAPSVIPDGFQKEKSDTTFRIFVLGESSTAGWPYAPNASFSRYLQRKLTLLYPQRRIEVINLGMTAVNTFTMRDILPDVLREHPDVIIFYNGHNEYYGTLGTASSESFGKSRFLVNLMLKLERFKTFQLTENIIRYFSGIFHSAAKEGADGSNETLMAKMVGESLVPYNSEAFRMGLEQFEGNMRDMLEMAKKAGVPVILGTLASNLKDQAPFVSVNAKGLPKADDVYREARECFSKGDFAKAKELFLKAKDLDALRFRAPEEINSIIEKLGREFNCPVAPVEKDFDNASPEGITGKSLMTDHLHPNLKGYRLMGQSYYSTMKNYSLLPKAGPSVSEKSVDSTLNANFPFTRLDSTVADIRLRTLLGAYPFVPRGNRNVLLENFKPRDFIDSTAQMLIERKTYWEKAHQRASEYYFRRKDYTGFKKEMNAIIEERPYNEASYGFAAEMLIKANLLNDALPYLKKLQALKPNAFSEKWLGLTALNGKKYQEALYYLEGSLQYSQDDPQVWYNLAGVYFNMQRIDDAAGALRKCLRISPNYPPARIFYSQLMSISAGGKPGK
ncbi:MAG TPA: tetratricopeptide repeat protein [Ignavibacteriales bacterium]|nr:tetratricopeptide repeat protein [Ignavibacteriales bacterium]